MSSEAGWDMCLCKPGTAAPILVGKVVRDTLSGLGILLVAGSLLVVRLGLFDGAFSLGLALDKYNL